MPAGVCRPNERNDRKRGWIISRDRLTGALAAEEGSFRGADWLASLTGARHYTI